MDSGAERCKADLRQTWTVDALQYCTVAQPMHELPLKHLAKKLMCTNRNRT